MEIKNPFSPSFPVNPEYFVNRTEVINSFRIAVERSVKTAYPTPDNIAILGDWGVGKSSVLRKFEWLCLNEFKDRKIFSAFVELVPGTCDNLETLATKIIDDVDRNVIAKSSLLLQAKNEIKEWYIKSIRGFGVGAERKIRTENPATFLKDALLNLWEIVERSGGDTMVLMLDDLHYLSEKYPDGLYDLRGIFQSLPKHGCNFIVVISGKKELFADIRELAEPLSRFFNIKHSLLQFGPKETRDAVTKPIHAAGLNIQIDDRVIEKVYELSRGHPFFIHFIMRELIAMKGSGMISSNYFDESYKEIQKTMEREKFEIDYSIASPKEREVLLAAAKLKDQFNPSNLKIKNVRAYLTFLIKKNLVKKHERGEYSLYHPLFRNYLLRQKS
ncbi:MAG: ATP-binding protein [Candidatus Micrarchaeota archaeon]